jgi:hypothetical protein
MGPGATMNGSSSLSRQPTTNSKDPRARAKSRDYLKQCVVWRLVLLLKLTPLSQVPAGDLVPHQRVDAEPAAGPARLWRRWHAAASAQDLA